ncbi:MAG TPA: GNAT family N-acetyltransferase [Anaerolineales bacterium]|nr:GNAT family N-acetyltransferase [Anaerolineales bacterium]
MTSYTLRPARETDSGVIRDLILSVGINPMSLDWRRFVVAVDDRDRVIATGQIKPHGANADIHELASIAVVPEQRGQGIARAIIEHLLEDSPRPLYLTCRSRLEPLYQKFGFQAISYDEMPRYYQRISKLAGFVEAVASLGKGNGLSVMKLQ